MPGISLDYLCRDRAQSMSLEALTGSVLGIEVDHYLRRLVQQSRTPLFTPWGGIAQMLLKTVDQDLAVLKRFEIKPCFVFTGLQVLSQHDVDPNARLSARTHALHNLEKKRNDETVIAFSALTNSSDLTSALKDHLLSNSIDFMVAPYFAGAQLTFMLNIGTIDAVHSSVDILVFGADRVITELTLSQSPRLTFCDKAIVLGLQLQGLNEDQFLDAYLFAGNEFCPIVPILEPNPPSEFSAYRMRAAADVVRQNGTGYLALNGNPALDKKPTYLEQWMKARALFKHHPYLNKDGEVVLLRAEKAPNDVARVIGARLPREIYFYLSRAIVQPDVLNALLSGTWRETVPLDGGETREYRFLLDSLNEIRVQCLDLLHGSKQLHHYYEKKVVATDRWYQDEHREEIEKLEIPLYNDVKHWKIPSSFVTRYSQSGSSLEPKSLVEILANPEAIKASFTSYSKAIETVEELAVNTMFRLLQIRGYISSDHNLTHWGKALLHGLNGADGDMAISVIVAVEMLRMRAIKAEDFSTRFMQEPPEKEPVDAQWKILGRLGALLPLQQNDAPWQGPIDHDALIAFSLAQTTRKYLSALYEMTRLSLLLRGDAKRSDTFIKQLRTIQNPFTSHYDAGMATYTKLYLAKVAERDAESTREQEFQRMKNVFPSAKDGASDIAHVWDLWDAIYRVVQSALESRQMGNVEQKKFERANKWLTTHR